MRNAEKKKRNKLRYRFNKRRRRYKVRIKRELYIAQNGMCALCPHPLPLLDDELPETLKDWRISFDHRLDISKGGDVRSIDNLQLAHVGCNQEKELEARKHNAAQPTLDVGTSKGQYRAFTGLSEADASELTPTP